MNRFLLRAELRAVLPNGVVLHASSIVLGKCAYVFLAPSGGGKSTIIEEFCKKGYGAIADDSVVVSEGTDGVIRCLPCASMKLYAKTEDISPAPLKALFFLEKGSPVCTIPVNPQYALYRTLRSQSVMAYGHISQEDMLLANHFLSFLYSNINSFVLRYDHISDSINRVVSHIIR